MYRTILHLSLIRVGVPLSSAQFPFTSNSVPLASSDIALGPRPIDCGPVLCCLNARFVCLFVCRPEPNPLPPDGTPRCPARARALRSGSAHLPARRADGSDRLSRGNPRPPRAQRRGPGPLSRGRSHGAGAGLSVSRESTVSVSGIRLQGWGRADAPVCLRL